jgi:predicted secreted protein
MPTSGVTGVLMTLSIEGQALAESRDFSLTQNQESIDLTNRDSSWWKESTPGLRDWNISGGGLYIYNDHARQLLDWHWHDRSPSFLTIVITMADGTITKQGEGFVTNITYPGPHAGAGEISFALEGTHELEITAS